MKSYVLSFLVLALSGSCIGQSLSPQLVSSAGKEFSDGAVYLSWSLGELSIVTYDLGNPILTQGFHQPEILPGSITEQFFQWNVYPNPASELVFVEINGLQLPERIELFDAQGKLVFQGAMSTSKMSIPVANLEDGIYFLRLCGNTQIDQAQLTIIR